MSEIFLFESTFSDHEGTYHHMPNHMAKGHTDYCRWQPSIYSLMRYHEGHNHISDVQKSSIVTSPCDSNRTRFDTPSCGRVFGRNAMGSYFRDVNVPSSFQLRVRLGQASHGRGSVQTTDSERKSIKLSALWAAPGGAARYNLLARAINNKPFAGHNSHSGAVQPRGRTRGYVQILRSLTLAHLCSSLVESRTATARRGR